MKKIAKHTSEKKHEQTWADGDKKYVVGVKRSKMLDTVLGITVTAREVDVDDPIEYEESLSIRKGGLPENPEEHVAAVLEDARQRALKQLVASRRARQAWELIPEGDE